MNDDSAARQPPRRMGAVVRAALGPELPGALAGAFATEVAATNQRRLRVILPLVCGGHLVHVAIFWPRVAERASLLPQVLEWRRGIAFAHAGTFVLALLLVALAFSSSDSRRARLLGPLTALVYLLHAAVVVGIDQLTVTSVTPFIGYCLGVAGVLVLPPPSALLAFAVGLGAYVAGIVKFQALPEARLAVLPNGVSIAVLGLALSALLYAARRRDFVQRHTIEEQQRQLGELNESLERRVAEQVGEIVARAAEVESLNAQLRAQVRERSKELSLALAQLARRDGNAHLPRGTLLGGRFEIERLLGEGGMGSVYAGVDRSTRNAVAIKVVQASSQRQLAALERFLREARTAATINHPAVVRMLHVDVSEDGMLYQVQELVIGETLESHVRAETRWAPGAAARLVAVLSDALAAAHAEGVVHRDVKPANVMLTADAPGLKLLDFGISKLYQDQEWAAGAGATLPGTMLGTPAYMAPEQVGGGSVTDRVDVYAAGVVLFQLLTGRHPFEGDTSRDVLTHHLVTVPPAPHEVDSRTPARLSELARDCLQKDPAKRPSAAELSAALRSFADTSEIPLLPRLAENDAGPRAERTAVEGRRRYNLASGAD